MFPPRSGGLRKRAMTLAERTAGLQKRVSVVVTILSVILILNFNSFLIVPRTAVTGGLLEITSPVNNLENSKQLKTRRQNIRSTCEMAKTVDEMEAISQINKAIFTMPTSRTPLPRDASDPRTVKRCTNVVMDFGANIGDTSGHVIDTGLIGCQRNNKGAKDPHFDVIDKQIKDPQRGRNRITKGLIKMMTSANGDLVGPEDYCYYGVEGNPVFTDRLQELEDFVMAIRPRPIQHMHFFTESVGAGEDGMTKLYLDTVNGKENFWGSSIMKGHQDVRKSAEAGNTTADELGADVMGYTLGTLMRKTLKAFDPEATPEEKTGGHFLLKVDIEGGEYPLLHQAADEGTLCEYTKMGNKADLVIEYHSQRVTGRHSQFNRKFEQKLKDCGVNFQGLQAFWN